MIKDFLKPATDTAIKPEKIHTEVFRNSLMASQVVAAEIAGIIRSKQKAFKPCVLGLATGSTPQKLYTELIRLHREEGLSFKNVHTFNLDEYFPMSPESIFSYVRFMKEVFFNHIDIPKENCHIPDGKLAPENIAAFCKEYETLIEELGGIDIQLLGIGRNGHIGFNEPGSLINSHTRLVTLDQVTRASAANEFNGIINVPEKAITTGVSTIMNARRIILMAWGESKAHIVKQTIEGPATNQNPASFLQLHPNATFVIDEPCSIKLMRIHTSSPCIVNSFTWNKALT